MAPNKKKKKPVANPARGFATVSVPSSKPKNEPTEEPDHKTVKEDAASDERKASRANVTATSHQGANTTKTENMSPEELEQHLEASELRLMVEKHGPKIKRDIARQVKALETDRRLLRLQATPLESMNSANEGLVTKIIDLVKQQPSYSIVSSPLPTAASALTPEMDLCLKVWTLYETLTELEFPVVEDVIKHILNYASFVPFSPSSARDAVWGLEEALYWYAINVEERELPQFDRTQGASSQPGIADEELPEEFVTSSGPNPKQAASSKSSSAIATPANTSDVSSSESDDGADPPSVVQYVELQSRLFVIQHALPPETPPEKPIDPDREAHKLSAKITRIERDPLFDTREADYAWKSHKHTLEIEAAQHKARAREASRVGIDGAITRPVSPEGQLDEEQERPDEEGGISGLFELGDNLPDAEGEAGPEVAIKDFGKWSGTNPRKVLEDVCKARDSGCRVSFKLVSTSFHSCRHQIDIIWSKDLQQDFPADMLLPEIGYSQGRRKTTLKMKTIATSSTAQSEAYAATICLFAMSADSQQAERPQLRLPTVWRHLYTDLTDRKSEYDADQDVKKLGELRHIVLEHLPAIEARQKTSDRQTAQGINGAELANSQDRIVRSTPPTELQNIWNQKSSSPAYQKMLLVREQLPVYKQKLEFIELFDSQQLMILCGETGSGKSTQTPALILENELSAGRDCKILCTQPRRISAMSLASRVSEELGEQKNDLGTMRSLVGYAIRLESKQSAATRLTYATTGVAMRLLEKQDDLANINVLLIDEVHERNIDSDFLLIVLRRLLPRRPDLKVVLMSATIDAEKFSAYLNHCPILMVPGRLFSVQTMFLEDAIEATNTLATQQNMGMGDYEEIFDDDDDVSDAHSHLQNLNGYSEKTISTLKRLNEYRIDFGLITKVAVAISSQPELSRYSKAILIFMPGIAEIRRLHQVMTSYPQFQKGWLFHILHSTISTEDQQAAFRVPPPGTRKIVIATNIAETGVTIPDITAVIDTGKEKIMRFDERRQVSRLTESFVSKASSRQRQGRAARVQEGLCVKLYTRDRFERLMPDHSTPEILRLSLSETILRVKLCALGTIETSLSEALDPPTPKNVRRAIEALKEEKVLTPSEDLTPLGRQLARLPLDIPLGKLVLNGLSFQCLDAMCTIAALLSSKSPFLTTTKSTTSIDTIRRTFARGDSDLLLLYSVYEAWKTAELNSTAGTFCQKHLLSRPTLSLIEDQKAQLLTNLFESSTTNPLLTLTDAERTALQSSRSSSYKYRSSSAKRTFSTLPARYNTNASNDSVLNAATALSFYPKLLRRESRNAWRNVATNQSVTLSPGSINREPLTTPPPRWLSFYQTLQTKSHHLSVSETSAVDELSIALLLGEAEWKVGAGVLGLDGSRIRFRVGSWKGIVALRELREKGRALVVERKADNGEMGEVERKWVELFWEVYKTG